MKLGVDVDYIEDELWVDVQSNLGLVVLLLVMKQKIGLSWCLNWWVFEKLQTRIQVQTSSDGERTRKSWVCWCSWWC